MNPLLLSLAAGILIGLLYGLLYGLLKVRSPAPPAIALVGLLGMLLGGALVHAVLPAEHATTLQRSDAPFVTPVSRVS
jgi:XapX domain-containing protein